MNDGEEGHIFASKFKPFTPSAINDMVGMYIRDGHSPSSQLIWKMQSQVNQNTYMNDFTAKCIGTCKNTKVSTIFRDDIEKRSI